MCFFLERDMFLIWLTQGSGEGSVAGSAIELRIKAARGDTSSMIEIQTLQPLTLNIVLCSSFIIVYLSTI